MNGGLTASFRGRITDFHLVSSGDLFNLYLIRKGSLRLKSIFQERPGQDRQHQVITKKLQTGNMKKYRDSNQRPFGYIYMPF
jgi:hypothetical protein